MHDTPTDKLLGEMSKKLTPKRDKSLLIHISCLTRPLATPISQLNLLAKKASNFVLTHETQHLHLLYLPRLNLTKFQLNDLALNFFNNTIWTKTNPI